MRSSSKSFYALVFLATAFFSPLHFASANTPVLSPVVRGSAVTIHWVFAGGVANCSGDTTYPDNNVKNAWVKVHAAGDTPVSFTAAAVPGSYSFTCTNASTGAADSATLIITDCSAGTHWSGNSCVANVCNDGALGSSYPTCDQCPNGQYYNTQTQQCSNCRGSAPTGCSGIGGTIANPIPGTLTCNNTASNPPSCNVFAPSCPTLSTSKSDINAGDTVGLTWVCKNAASCTEIANSDGFSTGGRTNGSDNSVTPSVPSGQVVYGLTCGGSPFYFPAITVHAPTATISANPTRVTEAGQIGKNCSTQPLACSTISWNAANVVRCSVTGPGLSRSNLVGANLVSSVSVLISAQSTFTISCTTNGPTITNSVIVNAPGAFRTF